MFHLLAETSGYPGWVLMVAGAMIILFFATIVGPRRRKRMESDEGSLGRLTPSPRDLGEVNARHSLEAVFVQLQEFSRETLARLDTKIRILNQLLVEADRKIETLSAMARGGAPAGAVPSATPSNPARPAPPAEPRDPDASPASAPGLRESVYRLHDAGRSIPEIARETSLEAGEVELVLSLRKLPT